MSNIKVLILDIDGTISGKSNQVSEKVKKAIKEVKNKGIKVGLATGRMYRSALRFHHDIEADLPIIGYNGAWIQNPENSEILLHNPVNKEKAQDLFFYLKEQQKINNNIEIHFYFDDQLYVEKITEKTDFYVERSGIGVNIVDDLNSLLHQNPTKILASSPDYNLISQMLVELKKRYQDHELYLTQSNPIYLEATQANVNKGTAVKYLVEKILGFTAEEIMTIGDNFNDYSMLGYAGFSVAMGDAPKEVKAITSFVTRDVENDGVAEAIAKYIL
ncbi:hydrolase [Geminocystis sp. NIES-3708]|uniref:Cof-type HAD-IIB family hydrolase n=1 Tax=Geminocystis sp. NIES-3708 TaxID=1615909 RepID=UPI0005FC4E72|nr:HAD family hydrolase [Geminocystis sp. NIES-3708]BAQ59707.1 hydrolase [Geminocystis sp. NIES-3708]